MLGLKNSDLQFNSHQAREHAIIEEQIDEEIGIANLKAVFFPDKSEVFAKLENKILKIRDYLAAQIFFFIRFW